MKLKTRIKILCFTMAAIIVLASATVLMVYISDSLKNNAENSIKAVNRQTLLALSNVVDSMNVTSRLPILDQDIYGILQTDYSVYPESMRSYYQYRDNALVKSRLYSLVFYQNPYVSAVTIIPSNTGKALYQQRSGYSPDIDDLKNQEWYRMVRKAGKTMLVLPAMQDELYGHDRKIISIARVVTAGTKPLAILKVDALVSDLDGIWKNALTMPGTQIVVMNGDGTPIYTTFNQTKTDVSELFRQIKSGGKNEMTLDGVGYLVTLTQYGADNYQLLSFTPLSEIRKGAVPTMLGILTAALLCIAAAFALAEFFSDRVMQPIRELKEQMGKVQAGDLSTRASVKVGGEFGDVCRSFNAMVENTEQLVARIYEEEKQKHEAEYQALQAQISPHFLMNTLNAIKWMAFLQGSKSIESALTSLSAILSFAVRENEDKITIEKEMQQIGYYINILALRYPNRFVFQFDIQPEAQECLTLKYMLQPILENSVFHGLDGQGDGLIDVRVFVDGSDRVNYEVRDNGKGMSEEQIRAVLNGEAEVSRWNMNKVGIYNVNQRIKMTFGEAYGISIESVEGQYTLVRIVIPKEKKS